MHRRAPTASTRRSDALNQIGGLERLEVLANRGVGETEVGRQLGCGGAVGALQVLDDSAFGTGEVVADVVDGSQPNERRPLGKLELQKLLNEVSRRA